MTEVQLLKKIGQRIKQIREDKELTQDKLGIEMSLGRPKTVKEYDKSNVSRLEAGKSNPRIFTLYRVSQALGVTLDELLKIEEQK
jgi:transcriptional regulator with XRE-family HTH domain